MATRILTTLLILSTLGAFTACSGCDQPAKQEFRVEIVSVEFRMSNEYIKDDAGRDDWLYHIYTVKARIYGVDGAVQEVAQTLGDDWCGSTLNRGACTVEYFQIGARDWEWHEDLHFDRIGTVHEMTLYPGEVEGADISDSGFAMLPENEDGSAAFVQPWWDLNGANVEHLASHQVQGRVSRSDRGKAIHWTIAAEPEGVRITINGESTFYPATDVGAAH
jgi:hypothetical protein